MLGEMHGTEEAPAFVNDIACNALASNLKVTVALELPNREDDYLREYLKSGGDLKAKVDFLTAPFWAQDYQDGRASTAMLQLIDDIRLLQKAGYDVDILFMDDPWAGLARDEIMATRLLKKILSNPDRLFISLTGNLHNRLEGARMGWFIKEEISTERIFSLNQRYQSGTAWVCMGNGGCGVHELTGDGSGDVAVVLEEDYRAGAYSGYYETKAIRAAPPAIRALR